MTLRPEKKSLSRKQGSATAKRPQVKSDISTVIGARAFQEFLPTGWTSTYDSRMLQAFKSPREKFHAVKLIQPDGKIVRLQILEHPKFIEVEGIFAENKGAGSGTVVMTALKEFADTKSKGIMVRDVSNEKFFNKFTWLKQVPDPLEDYGANPNYVYKVSGDMAEPLEIIEDDW